MKARPHHIRSQSPEDRGEGSAETPAEIDKRQDNKYERGWTVRCETENSTRKMRTSCYFLPHRKAWMDIGRRNAHTVRTKGNFCMVFFFHFRYKRKLRRRSPYVFLPLAYSHLAESKGLGAAAHWWIEARSVTFGCGFARGGVKIGWYIWYLFLSQFYR